MVPTKTYDRVAWEDRFNRPTAVKLRSGLAAPRAKLLDLARRHLNAIEGVSEGFVWRGACWRWTFEYHIGHSEEPLAVLVPSPADLQLAMPLDRDFVRLLEARRLKRWVRDGVGLAGEAFDTRWGVWSIGSEPMLDDLADLIDKKLSHLTRQAG